MADPFAALSWGSLAGTRDYIKRSCRLTSVKAKYTVFIPSEAKQVAVAAHHFLAYGQLPTGASTVHFGHPFDTLVTFAEDSPEIDSHMKQLGTFVGELANAQSIHVTKETGKAMKTWEMHNPYYQPPMTPSVHALEPQHSPSMQPQQQPSSQLSPPSHPTAPSQSTLM